MNDEPIIVEIKNRMQKAIAVLQDDLATIRTGRATPALVENIIISAYDNTQNLRIKELATITTEGPRMLIIAPFDPTIIKDIERGINAQNLGLAASVDSHIIRINIPPLTADRREEFIKLSGVKIEGGRVMVRQIRHDLMIQIKRQFEANEISEDVKRRHEKEIQVITDEMMAEIELIREKKEQELREV